MTQTNSEPITGTLALTVQTQDKGQYICDLSLSLSARSQEPIRCFGQTPEHALAIAAMKLAARYRALAQEQQNLDWGVVERLETGEPMVKHYHVILHYERRAEAESKFESMHETIMGNTVVENAQITVIEIGIDLPVEPLVRGWD